MEANLAEVKFNELYRRMDAVESAIRDFRKHELQIVQTSELANRLHETSQVLIRKEEFRTEDAATYRASVQVRLDSIAGDCKEACISFSSRFGTRLEALEQCSNKLSILNYETRMNELEVKVARLDYIRSTLNYLITGGAMAISGLAYGIYFLLTKV